MANHRILGCVLALALAGGASAAVAQGIEVGPGGVGVYTDPYAYPPPPPEPAPGYYAAPDARISVEEAVAIAQNEGIVRVTDVNDDEDKIEVEGDDGYQEFMAVTVDAQTGDVIDIDR